MLAALRGPHQDRAQHDTSIRLEQPREARGAGEVTLSVSASGGLGGHSGVNIAHGRANAIKAIGRALREVLAVAPFRLVSVQSGKSWNAIRDATAICLVIPEGEAAFRAAVEASAAEAVTTGSTLTLHSLSRSSNASALPEVLAALEAAARVGRGSLELGQADAGWRPNLGSPALDVARRVFERLFGEPPTITAVHAWLETAVIGDRVPSGLDMLSFGPQIEAPHSPDERVSIPTV